MEFNINFPNLHIFLEHVGKDISIGGFTIHYYGLIIALGMLAGILMACFWARRTGQSPDDYLDLGIIAIISSIIGARIYYVVFRWDLYKDNFLSIINIREGGLAIYGAVIAAILTTFLFSRIKKLNFGQLCDTAGLGLILGQIIGRWGNFFNREAFGGYTDGIFAMQLPVSAVRYSEITPEQLEHLVEVDGVTYIQAHPTFLYEGLWNLALLIILLLFYKYKRFHGQVFLLYLLGYGVGRFWIEALRTDQLLIPGIRYPISMVLAAILAAASLIWVIIGSIKGGERNRKM